MSSVLHHASVLIRLSQSNILISHDEPTRALLGDVGLNVTVSDILSLSRGSVNWSAPELLSPHKLIKPSLASDAYAFAMTIYEASSHFRSY